MKYPNSFDFICQPFKNCKNHYLLTGVQNMTGSLGPWTIVSDPVLDHPLFKRLKMGKTRKHHTLFWILSAS